MLMNDPRTQLLILFLFPFPATHLFLYLLHLLKRSFSYPIDSIRERDGENEGGEKGRRRTSVTNLSLRPRPYQQCEEQMEGKRETIKPLVYQRCVMCCVVKYPEYRTY